MARLDGSPLRIIQYDLNEYDLRPPIREAFNLPNGFNLANLHTAYPPESIVTRDNDSLLQVHSVYYERIGETDFNIRYRRVIHELILPLFGDDIAVQKVPTIRVHRSGSRSTGEAHRDSDHGYGHQPGAVNIWWPLTDVIDPGGSDALWVDTTGGRNNLQPIKVRLGQVVVFDATGLYHDGSRINTTNHTRVSCDFRVVPMTDYIDSDNRAANTGAKLAIGDYYEKVLYNE